MRLSNLGLHLGKPGVPAAGGGGGIPASVTHFVQPADMDFTGGVWDGTATDQVAADSSYVMRAGVFLEGDTTDGLLMVGTDTTFPGISSASGLFGTAANFALRFKRNGVADNQGILLTTNNNSNYGGIADDDDNVNLIQQGTTVDFDILRLVGTDYSSNTTTRQTLWNAGMADTTDKVYLFKDMVNGGTNIFFGGHGNGAFRLNGYIGGWARFTDWADADDVATALLASP